ncbi:phage adaptor protein [Fundidesulfovibrio putealis]|uniref:phage adaptor protein n=1 Tax=Fundidesulfovibrio putealis TaxID=270496 RepID=UPI0012EB0636|nr:hypothetical protein [Fundidesulfovibrio putealis]
MKISDLIKYVRQELEDEINTRWTDEKLLSFMRRAFVRASHLIRRNGIELGKRIYEIDVVAGTKEYDLPYDFMSPIALFNGNTQLIHRTIEQFNEIQYATPVSNYIIIDNKIWVLGIPVEASKLNLFYYSLLVPEEIVLTGETPWDGKLDMLIIEYLTLRTKNVDEMDISADVEFMKDFETAILETYKTVDPIVISNRGWM